MGGGGHGHGHVKFPEMPDFRIYNVDDVPVLKEVQRKLAVHGLKDPWLRNEVWRYQVVPFKQGLLDHPILHVLFRGFKYGVVIAVAATAVSKTFARKPVHH